MAGDISRINGRKNVAMADRPAVIRMREIAEKIAEERFEEMIRAQMDAAIGITTENYDKDGELEYKELGPNTNAAKFVTDLVIPKRTEVKHTGGIGILHLVQSLEDPQDESYGSE